MEHIPVAIAEFSEGGKAIWIHNDRGCTVFRIQCTGRIKTHKGCVNICAHADLNVEGDIEICIP